MNLSRLDDFESYIPYASRVELEPNTWKSYEVNSAHAIISMIHRDDMPPAPKSWKAMLKHPRRDEYMKAVGAVTKEPLLTTRIRHVDIKQHWLRQLMTGRDSGIQIQWIGTDEMVADGLTKVLGKDKQAGFVAQLGLTELKD